MHIYTQKLLLLFALTLSITASAQNQAKLMLPIGHTGQVLDASFSKDGSLVATSAEDKSIKIWDVQSSYLLANLHGHKRAINHIEFKADGTQLLSFSKDDGKVIIWESLTGKRLATPNKKNTKVNYAEFSPNGKYILTSFADSTIAVWDAKTFKVLSYLKNNNSFSDKLSLSPNGSFLLSASGESNVLTILKLENEQLSRYHTLTISGGAAIRDASFSPDGSVVVVTTPDTVWTFDYLRKTLHSFSAPKTGIQYATYSPDGKKFVTISAANNSINIYNAYHGADGSFGFKILKRLNPTGDDSIRNIQFSPNSKKIVAGFENEIVLWETETESVKPIWQAPLDNEGLNKIQFSADGKLLVSAMQDKTGMIWDAETGELINTLDGHTAATRMEEFSKDGSRLFTAGEDGFGRVWNAETGDLLRVLQGHEGVVNSIRISPRFRNRAVTASDDSTVKVWDTEKGTLITTFKNHKAPVVYAEYSPESYRIVTASLDSTAGLWQLDTVTHRWRMIAKLRGHNAAVDKAIFSPDGSKVMTYSIDHPEIRIWDAYTGKLKSYFVRKRMKNQDEYDFYNDQILSGAFFSDDSKYIYVASYADSPFPSGGIVVWDTETGKMVANRKLQQNEAMIRYMMPAPNGRLFLYFADNTAILADRFNLQTVKTFSIQLSSADETLLGAEFSRDGQYLALSFTDNTTGVWRTEVGGQRIATLASHVDDVNDAHFSPDGKYILTSSEDNTMKKWSVGDWKLLFTMVPIDVNDYLVLDKDNRWDGTQAARDLLYVTCGTEFIDLSQFKDLGWEPGLVRKILGQNKEPIKARALKDIQVCNFTPLVYEDGYSKANRSYGFRIYPRDGGLGDVKVYVENRLVKIYGKESLVALPQNGFRLTVPDNDVKAYFTSGKNNQVYVIAGTANNTMTSRGERGGEVISTGNATTITENSNIYILSIGINEYAGNQSQIKKLTYAVPDAVDFSSAVTKAAKKLQGNNRVFSYLFTTDPGSRNRPDKQSIRNAISQVAQKATADDIFILFFAGHGKVPQGQNQFYMLTTDATSFDLKPGENTAINTNELNTWLREVKARNQILVLDACQSGQAINSLGGSMVAGDISSDQVRALERIKDNAGAFILSASTSDQNAQENQLYGHGFLTYALLSGIHDQTAVDNSKKIDVSKWFNTARTEVIDLARSHNLNQVPQIIGRASYPVGKVDDEVVNGIRLNAAKKIITNTILSVDDGTNYNKDPQKIGAEVNMQLVKRSEDISNTIFRYVADNTSGNTYYITGKYRLNGNAVESKLALFLQGDDTPLQEFTVTGTLDKKTDLAKAIADKAEAILR